MFLAGELLHVHHKSIRMFLVGELLRVPPAFIPILHRDSGTPSCEEARYVFCLHKKRVAPSQRNLFSMLLRSMGAIKMFALSSVAEVQIDQIECTPANTSHEKGELAARKTACMFRE